MATEPLHLLVRRLGQSTLLDPAQLKELTGPLVAQFTDPKALAQELVRRGWVTIYQIQQVALGRQAELVLGPYLLLDKLGEGGNGQVFKARHQRLGRIVALKVVRPELLSDSDTVNRFYREIEVISQISHPNIVHAYDAGPIGSSLVLAMEFVDGIDLDQLVKQQGPLPVRDACEYIRQAACGLAHAHERGLIHRDIKPGNLLLSFVRGPSSVVGIQTDVGPKETSPANPGQRTTDHGLIKILDMGLARLQQPARDSKTRNLTVLAGNTMTLGTPDYQAPEQAVDFHRTDIRADIYSLGCTLYYLLTGRPPFEGTVHEKLLKHQQAEPKPIQELRNDVPAELGPIIQKMMAKLPVDRYQTPADLEAELAALIAPLPVSPSPAAAQFPSTTEIESVQTHLGETAVQPPAEEGKPARRRVLLLAGLAGGVLGLLLVGTLLIVALSGSTDTSAKSPAASSPVARTTAAPSTPVKGAPGLRFAYYEGVGPKLPNFEILIPLKHGATANFTLKERKRENNFGFVFTGVLQVDRPGKHTFFATSDDAIRLYINDKLLIEDDGPHSAREKSAVVDLPAGKHPIKVHFAQGTGKAILEMFWQPPGGKKEPIPDAVLFQS